VLVYSLPLLIFLSGLKCIVAQEGRLPVHQQFTSKYAFHLRPVNGSAAMLTGLGYICLGIFGALSIGNPPPANRKWIVRAARGIARWGSLILGFCSWQKIYEGMGMGSPWPTLKTADDFRTLLLVISCFGVVFLLCFLRAMYQREAIKYELCENGCVPQRIWWHPAAYWNMMSRAAAFHVIYLDPNRVLHKAYCYVYRPLLGSIGAARRVRFLQDEVIGERPASDSWVFVDSQIIRPKLED
jgi:hypothetical protein